MTSSSTSAPVLIAAACSPRAGVPPAGGTPNACCVIVAGPSGTVDAAGTDAPLYPPYREPTAEPRNPVPRLRPAMSASYQLWSAGAHSSSPDALPFVLDPTACADTA